MAGSSPDPEKSSLERALHLFIAKPKVSFVIVMLDCFLRPEIPVPMHAEGFANQEKDWFVWLWFGWPFLVRVSSVWVALGGQVCILMRPADQSYALNLKS